MRADAIINSAFRANTRNSNESVDPHPGMVVRSVDFRLCVNGGDEIDVAAVDAARVEALVGRAGPGQAGEAGVVEVICVGGG